MNPIRLLIVEDHHFFRRSILPPLQEADEIEIVGTAASGEEALALVHTTHPHVVLMDLHLPQLSGLAVIQQILPHPRPDLILRPAILVLTGDDDADGILHAFDMGVTGYLNKTALSDELLITAIVALAKGGIFLDPAIFARLRTVLAARRSRLEDHRLHLAQLSKDDRQLLRYVTLGWDNAKIGQKFSLSAKTVSNRLSQIYLDLGVENRVQAATLSLRNGLVDLVDTL